MFCTLKAGVPKAPPRVIEYRSYKHYDKERFLWDPRTTDWSHIYNADDVNNAVNTWCIIYTSTADQHALFKIQRVKGLKTRG